MLQKLENAITVSNYKKPTVLKSLIYFTEGEIKLYLLVKTAPENKWRLPEFNLNLEAIDKQIQIDTENMNQIYLVLEECFAISRNEVKSVEIQTEINEEQALVISIEIKEEGAIVLSNKYQDYAWVGQLKEINSN